MLRRAGLQVRLHRIHSAGWDSKARLPAPWGHRLGAAPRRQPLRQGAAPLLGGPSRLPVAPSRTTTPGVPRGGASAALAQCPGPAARRRGPGTWAPFCGQGSGLCGGSGRGGARSGCWGGWGLRRLRARPQPQPQRAAGPSRVASVPVRALPPPPNQWEEQCAATPPLGNPLGVLASKGAKSPSFRVRVLRAQRSLCTITRGVSVTFPSEILWIYRHTNFSQCLNVHNASMGAQRERWPTTLLLTLHLH